MCDKCDLALPREHHPAKQPKSKRTHNRVASAPPSTTHPGDEEDPCTGGVKSDFCRTWRVRPATSLRCRHNRDYAAIARLRQLIKATTSRLHPGESLSDHDRRRPLVCATRFI